MSKLQNDLNSLVIHTEKKQKENEISNIKTVYSEGVFNLVDNL